MNGRTLVDKLFVRKEDIMSDQEKAALLAAGEERLAFLGRAMEESIRDKDLSLAKWYRVKYEGALYMLEALELISYEEYDARSKAMFARFMEAAFPKPISKEAI